jgi:hypothetical protein
MHRSGSAYSEVQGGQSPALSGRPDDVGLELVGVMFEKVNAQVVHTGT